MTTKKIVILLLSLFAVVAVLVGLCLFFFTNKVIRDVPDGVYVQKIGQDYVLTTEFSDQYLYNFKLEQKIDGDFVLLDIVKSDKNCLNLSNQGLDLAFDNEFRFSAGFATENGSGDGDFCQAISWSSKFLTDVDYQNVKVDLQTNTVSWDEVKGADSYDLCFVDKDGNSWEFKDVTTNEFLLKNADETFKLKAGEYVLYVVAKSSDADVSPSNAGTGLEGIVISVQNEILDFSHDDGIFVTCSQKTNGFRVLVDEFAFEIPVLPKTNESGQNFVYDLSEFLPFFENLDFSKGNVSIKAHAYGLALESESFVIS